MAPSVGDPGSGGVVPATLQRSYPGVRTDALFNNGVKRMHAESCDKRTIFFFEDNNLKNTRLVILFRGSISIELPGLPLLSEKR